MRSKGKSGDSFYPKQLWAQMGKRDVGNCENYPKVLWAQMGNWKMVLDAERARNTIELYGRIKRTNQEKFYPKRPWAEMGNGEVVEKITSYPLLRTTLLATIRTYMKEFIRGITTLGAFFAFLFKHNWITNSGKTSAPPEITFQTTGLQLTSTKLQTL